MEWRSDADSLCLPSSPPPCLCVPVANPTWLSWFRSFMKISYNWINELVDVDLSPRDLAEKLTMAGLAVDAVEELGPDYDMDNILEFDLTSNRPDCLSHLGIAREAAAVSDRALRTPRIELIEA